MPTPCRYCTGVTIGGKLVLEVAHANTSSTQYESDSLGKTAIAALMGVAVHKGLIDLDKSLPAHGLAADCNRIPLANVDPAQLAHCTAQFDPLCVGHSCDNNVTSCLEVTSRPTLAHVLTQTFTRCARALQRRMRTPRTPFSNCFCTSTRFTRLHLHLHAHKHALPLSCASTHTVARTRTYVRSQPDCLHNSPPNRQTSALPFRTGVAIRQPHTTRRDYRRVQPWRVRPGHLRRRQQSRVACDSVLHDTCSRTVLGGCEDRGGLLSSCHASAHSVAVVGCELLHAFFI